MVYMSIKLALPISHSMDKIRKKLRLADERVNKINTYILHCLCLLVISADTQEQGKGLFRRCQSVLLVFPRYHLPSSSE